MEWEGRGGERDGRSNVVDAFVVGHFADCGTGEELSVVGVLLRCQWADRWRDGRDSASKMGCGVAGGCAADDSGGTGRSRKCAQSLDGID